jgi:hypothetical protein
MYPCKNSKAPPITGYTCSFEMGKTLEKQWSVLPSRFIFSFNFNINPDLDPLKYMNPVQILQILAEARNS